MIDQGKNSLLSWGLFTWRKEDPSTRKILEGGSTLRWVYMQKFLVRVVPKYRMFEKQLKMAGDKNKHTIWALLLSLLALTTSLQQNYHGDNNQLLYCRD